ncbi:MAG: crossover junction endodeoxyribonuclease RuvC [Candidatus Pacebacteria bacterium]|nr:crossover junction endodeoxyribonuclease RuvC [Candidatus Paceibacterota bacterium]
MRILGIDPGIERVGIAVVEKINGKENFIFSECFKTSPKLSHAERLLLIGEETKKIISEWNPTALSIEKLFFETNTKTAMSVAEARGVLLYEASSAGLSIFEYTPLEIKVAVTGYGKSDKQAIMNMVPKLLKLPVRKMIDDEVDAIAVALTCFAYEKMS